VPSAAARQRSVPTSARTATAAAPRPRPATQHADTSPCRAKARTCADAVEADTVPPWWQKQSRPCSCSCERSTNSAASPLEPGRAQYRVGVGHRQRRAVRPAREALVRGPVLDAVQRAGGAPARARATRPSVPGARGATARASWADPAWSGCRPRRRSGPSYGTAWLTSVPGGRIAPWRAGRLAGRHSTRRRSRDRGRLVSRRRPARAGPRSCLPVTSPWHRAGHESARRSRRARRR
jgi:hypothetical protein